MRRVDFVPPVGDQAWLDWVAEAASRRDTLELAYAAARDTGVTAKFKAKIDKKTYKGCAPFLNTLFHQHCAYCETPIAPGQKYIDVEHYRPKRRVVDFEYKPGKIPKPYDHLLCAYVDTPGKGHTGYFWLAYDIDNLLPSCLACNRYEKRCFFPVAGSPQFASSRLAFKQGSRHPEGRMLVNPYFDNPEQHFAFDDPEGVVRPLSLEGLISIEVYNLNREGLPAARRGAIRLATSDFNDWLEALTKPNDDAVLEKEAELDKLLTGERSYSTAARTHIGILEERIAARLSNRDMKYKKTWGIWPSSLVSRLPQ